MLAIYTRLSREDKDSTSIENQIREGRAFAKDKGFTDLKVYNEGEGVSGGAKIEDRPKLDSLIKDIVNGLIKVVWFRNQNRLERDAETYILFMRYAESNEVDVYFDDKKVDYDSPIDNFMGIMFSSINQYSRKLQSAQTKKTLKDHITEGRVWSVVAYGYRSDNGYLAIDEKEAEIIKEIYRLSLSGKGYNHIANHLNDKKIPTRKNKLWRARTVQSIIKNTLYKGVRVYSGKNYDAPIIIEPNYWKKVNDNLENNKNNSGKKVEHKYLLKGLIRCAKCGKNYYGRRRVNLSDNFYSCVGKRYKEIRCKNRGINIDVLENFIWGRFFADQRILEITKDFLKNDEIESKLDVLRENKEQLKKKIDKLEKEQKKAVDLLIKDIISEEEFTNSKQRIKNEIEDLKIKLDNLIEQISFFEESELTKENVKDDLTNLKNASFNNKSELIKKYIKSITIDYKAPHYVIRIEFKINDYYINEDNFKTDFSGSSEEIINPVNSITEKNLIENYIIDRSYNIAIDFCYNHLHPISKKVRNLSEKELQIYADRVENEFNVLHKPIIDLENNSIEFPKSEKNPK
ncbi:recombinase family protein [Polaribacter sp. MED152]|uniref:recombinase family protein n=1 Tax=Polaribacter sp. MED152 TaxID=313598 RepID=UPI000068C6EF|nr:recombinase family protein [Polaribacter sp. MED152]EAQ43036.1 recombinase [Polaribacter sp. MED152]